MTILKKSFHINFHKILMIFLVFMLFQSCKSYQKATNLEQASKADEKGYVKVTMVNGDEYIYETIEFSENTYYGIKTVNGEKVKTTLLKEDVLKVERKNKSSSSFFGIIGITIGVASIVLAILMFGG